MRPFPKSSIYACDDDLHRVVETFNRLVPELDFAYVFGCYEVFYPFFSCTAHAEEAFEFVINNMKLAGTNLGPSVSLALHGIDELKSRGHWK